MIPSGQDISELLRAKGFSLHSECADYLLADQGDDGDWSLIVTAGLRMTGWIITLRRRRVTQVLEQTIHGERVPVRNFETQVIGESEPLETVEAVTAWLTVRLKKAKAA